jgi:hypothetical protein
MAANGDRCERCWGRADLKPFALEGARPAVLCKACREAAPRDLLVFRDIYMRFSSTKEMVSHFGARDEEEALRKLCNEGRLDYKTVIRAIQSHGRAEPSNGFLDFSRPYGYEMRDGGLRVRPEEARTVGLIFEWYLEGKGIAKICRELNGAKVTTKTGKEWASQTVANILRNPLYCGYTRESGALRTGKHRRIVDQEVFSRVQVEMEKRIRRPDQKQESRLFRVEPRKDRR